MASPWTEFQTRYEEECRALATEPLPAITALQATGGRLAVLHQAIGEKVRGGGDTQLGWGAEGGAEFLFDVD